MPRMSKIWRKTIKKPVNEIKKSPKKKYNKFNYPDLETEEKIVSIALKCYMCSETVFVKVNKKDIIPKLGRPRGLRVTCNSCKCKTRHYTNGLIGGFESA